MLSLSAAQLVNTVVFCAPLPTFSDAPHWVQAVALKFGSSIVFAGECSVAYRGVTTQVTLPQP